MPSETPGVSVLEGAPEQKKKTLSLKQYVKITKMYRNT